MSYVLQAVAVAFAAAAFVLAIYALAEAQTAKRKHRALHSELYKHIRECEPVKDQSDSANVSALDIGKHRIFTVTKRGKRETTERRFRL